MAQSFIIVGAGIIGAMTALQLTKSGQRVRVVDAGQPSATAASFGWINASFFLDDAHHRLRAEGIAAWHRLTKVVPLAVQWRGCLCWDMPADEMAQTYARLRGFDYPAEQLTAAQIKRLAPQLKDPPETALFFPNEGAASSNEVAADCLRMAQELGAQVVRDVAVDGLMMQGSKAIGVKTAVGDLLADQVIVTAGVGSALLAQSAGLTLPMAERPAYIMRTAPVAPLLQHIFASPVGEIRQEPSGHILMPVAVGHQGDTSDTLTTSPVAAADDAMARLRSVIKGLETTDWVDVIRAARPVPQDGQPVIGPICDGVYVATLHSGITLGPLVAELIAKDVTDRLSNAETATLAPYRVDRFRDL